MAFMGGNEGMIVHFDQDFRKHELCSICCDVSWISKFPDECEVLFARSPGYKTRNNFACEIVDDVKGIQTISLTWGQSTASSVTVQSLYE